MKRMTYLLLALVLLLCSCGQSDSTAGKENHTPTWQEQYDLGVRYLSDGNYEEAILAFTAAIEIDPKRAPAYVGRGDAYVKSGETDQNLAAAKADYEKAIELDETSVDAYLGLADVYIRLGDYERAREILAHGVDKTGNNALQEMLDGIFVEEADANGFNAYGAKAFTLREEYIPFTELSTEGQEFIVQAATATIQNDRDTLLSLSEKVALALPIELEGPDSVLYTVWKQYKIGIYINSWGLNNEGVYYNYIWDIQIRPQNGMGYYAYMWRTVGSDASKNSSSWYWEYSDLTNVVSCPCIDWQWNGLFNGQEFSNALQHMDQETFNGALRKMQRNRYVTGQMKDSLRDGAFMVIFEDIDEYPNGERENYYYEHQYTENFDAGEYVGYDGDFYFGTKFSGEIYSIGDYNINRGYDIYVKTYYW